MGVGRALWAHLHLLDRQLVDRDGRLCGNVDDLELEERDGVLWVTGLRTGAGSLMRRIGARTFGAWLEQVHRGVDPARADHTLVPVGRVGDIGDHVTLSLDRTEVATWHGERWVADHVIAHIPGSGHDAGE